MQVERFSEQKAKALTETLDALGANEAKKIEELQVANEKRMAEMKEAEAKLMATFAENTEKKLAETVARLKK
jgi:hypothetical protein